MDILGVKYKFSPSVFYLFGPSVKKFGPSVFYLFGRPDSVYRTSSNGPTLILWYCVRYQAASYASYTFGNPAFTLLKFVFVYIRQSAVFYDSNTIFQENLRFLAENCKMIIPIRCFSCGKVIGNKWEAYLGLLQAEYTEG